MILNMNTLYVQECIVFTKAFLYFRSVTTGVMRQAVYEELGMSSEFDGYLSPNRKRRFRLKKREIAKVSTFSNFYLNYLKPIRLTPRIKNVY